MKKVYLDTRHGGKGFIGRHVCSVLLARGKNVVALDQKGPRGLDDKSHYPSMAGDVRDKECIEQIFREHSFTTIIHLASLLNTASQENPLDATQVNIVGSLNILEAARKYGISKVIYGSSISVYGSGSARSRDGVLETEPATPQDVYGATKRYVEIVGNSYYKKFGIQFVALRISSVIGPGAVNTASSWRSDIFEKFGLPHRAEVAFPYSSDESLPLVYVEDVADMFERIINTEQASFTVYNAPSESWILGELARYIESLDKSIQITFGQLSLSGIPRVINGQRFVNEFGYKPIPLKEQLWCAARSLLKK